jgi:hypothetical protein
VERVESEVIGVVVAVAIAMEEVINFREKKKFLRSIQTKKQKKKLKLKRKLNFQISINFLSI